MKAGDLSAKTDDKATSPVSPPGLVERPFFQRADWLSFGATTILSLTVYLFTLGPSVGLDNSGVWVTAAAYGGVSSPPGYPLWTLWAWIFAKLLPFSEIAWRVSVSSAVASALSCGLIALMVSRGGAAILERMSETRGLTPREERRLRAICGYAAGMVFGLNGAFWPQAVIVAVWPLSVLLLCLILCLLMRWTFHPGKRRFLYIAAFVYGLLLTNSQIELAFAPAIPFLVLSGNQKIGRDVFLTAGIIFLTGLIGLWMGYFPSLKGGGQFFIFMMLGVVTWLIGIGLAVWTRRAFTQWRAVLICCCSFLLGLALYFYLPIASMTDPPINWGYPRTVEGFFHVLTRGQYERMSMIVGLGQFWEQTRWYFVMTGTEFGWLFLPLCVIPLCLTHLIATPARKWMWGLLAPYFGLAFLMLDALNITRDRQSWELSKTYFSASYVVLALWMGCGLVMLGAWLAGPRKPVPELISRSARG